MKRVLVAVLLVGAMTGVSGQGSVSITGFDRPTVPTFALVTIAGNGFDSGAAISVVFSARDAITATVPAVTASSSTVRVAVPPLINSGSGGLFDTPVVADVQVVQVSSSSVMTSNTLGGLTIEPTPRSDDPPGTFTRAFVRTMLDVQSDLRTARQSTPGFADVVAASQAFADAQKSLLDAIELILKNREVTVNLSTKDNLPLSISAKSLTAMDRVGRAFVLQTNGVYRTSDPGPPRTTSCRCNAIALDIDNVLCEFRQNPCAAYDASGKVVPEGAISAYGAQFVALGSWAAGGLSDASFVASETAGGFGLLVSQLLAYVAAVLSGVDPPGASSLLRDAGTLLLDDLSNSGLGVSIDLQIAVALTQRTETTVTQTRGPLPTAPRGGVVVAAPQPEAPPANTRPAKVYTARPTPHWIATPVNQQVTTLTSATLPAPRVARFNGSYSGSASATCTGCDSDGCTTASASSAGTLSVLNGVVSSSGAVGSVSETGRFTAPSVGAPGLSCDIGGLFWLAGSGNGGAGASGFMRCGGPGVSCSGTFSFRRQ